MKSDSQVQNSVKIAISALTSLGLAIEQLESQLRSGSNATVSRSIAAVPAARARRGRPAKPATLPAIAAAPVRRKRTISPAARKFLKLQGKYLGLVRHLTARDQAKVKAIKLAKGYESAIKEATRLNNRG